MKSKIRQIAVDYLVMTVAVAVYSLAWECFMIPNGMSSGGLTGLCTIIQYATGGAIDVSASYLVFNVSLLAVGFAILGNAFGIRTIYCIGLSTFMFKMFGSMEFLHCIPGNFLFIEEKLLIPVVAGLIEGTAIGVILSRSGSTGGTDIVAVFLNKYWPISTGKAFLVLDVCIVTLILLLPERTLSDMVYGYLMMFASTYMVDFVLVGQKSSAQLLVFSSKHEEIADFIIDKLDRGVTVLKAQGWYTKTEKDVLLIIIGRSQLQELKKMIKSIDDKAFVSVCSTNGVFGEGFEEIKVGLKKKSLSVQAKN